MPRMTRFSWSILLVAAMVVYLFLGLWNQLNVSKSLPFDLEIYLEATQKAFGRANPYQPFEIGKSWVYPPSALLFLAPLASLPLATARLLWMALNIGLSLAGLLVLRRALRPALSVPGQVALAGLFLFYAPLLETIAVGQANCLVLLGLALFFLGSVEPRYAWVGDLGLAVAISIKMVPVLLLLIPLLRHDWRRCARSVLGLLGLAGLSALIFGLAPWQGFVEVLPRLFQGPHVFLNHTVESTLAVFLGSEAPGVSFWLGKGFSVLVLALWLLVTLRFARSTNPQALTSLGIVTMTVSSSLLWYHHLTFLLIPLCWLILSRSAGQPRWPAAMGWAALVLLQFDRIVEGLILLRPVLSILGYLLVYAACLAVVLPGWRRPAVQVAVPGEG